jgi:hypothetical protein
MAVAGGPLMRRFTPPSQKKPGVEVTIKTDLWGSLCGMQMQETHRVVESVVLRDPASLD